MLMILTYQLSINSPACNEDNLNTNNIIVAANGVVLSRDWQCPKGTLPVLDVEIL